MKAINAYLTFHGNCEEAFNFYRGVFGGEFQMISRFKEMPPEFKVEEQDREKLMHVALAISPGTVLMGSDTSEQYARGYRVGNNISLSVLTDSKEECERVFAALSVGGQVMMPLADTFWGSYFGMLTDPFGIQWMVSFDSRPESK